MRISSVDVRFVAKGEVISIGRAAPGQGGPSGELGEYDFALTITMYDPLRGGKMFENKAHRRTMASRVAMMPKLVDEVMQDFPVPAAE